MTSTQQEDKRPPTFSVKHGNKVRDLQMMTPKLIIAFGYLSMFCQKNNLPLTITNIIHKFPQSKSNTHPEGRALDISVRNWRYDDINNAKAYMEKVAGHLGALSSSDRQRRVFVYHQVPGGKPHIHLQVSR